MTSWHRGCVTLVTAVVAAATLLAQDQRPVFRAGADAVTVDVSVRDGSKVVADLTAADFDVRDNGVKQDVADVSFGKVPIDISVVFDVSTSVRPQLERLKAAIVGLVFALGPEDRMRAIQFNERVSRLADFTVNPKDVASMVMQASAGGATSVFDALSIAMASVDASDRRQLIVMFTDGADSSSVTDPSEILELSKRATATVSAVLPAQNDGPVRVNLPPIAKEHRKIYTQLASDTGGVVVESSRAEPLSKTFRKAFEEFRTSYVLHFSPKGAGEKGFHTLTVTVPSRGDKLTIRARRGYWQ